MPDFIVKDQKSQKKLTALECQITYWFMAKLDDWRRQGQEKYLKSLALTWKKYIKFRDDWDHDHCEFCSHKFMEEGNTECFHEGYATSDNYRWICKECFEDFRGEFDWSVN